MRIPFIKMHGAGNDFVVLQERDAPLDLSPRHMAAVADRHFGVGCDQVVVIGAGTGADAALRFFNPDGSESGACGNGSRCAAALLMVQSGRDMLTLQTGGGCLRAERRGAGAIWVDMGPPRFGWAAIPLAAAGDTLHLALPGDPAAVSMGNPQITFFGEAVDAIVGKGAAIAANPLFSEGVNVGFAAVEAHDRIRLRVWERGAGLTLACGSGACAALVNAHRRGLAGRHAAIVMDGGVLHAIWRQDDHVELSGPVETAFQGEIDPTRITAPPSAGAVL